MRHSFYSAMSCSDGKDSWRASRFRVHRERLPRCRLALHALVFGNLRAVAILWGRFVRELRFSHWETLTPLPRMPGASRADWQLHDGENVPNDLQSTCVLEGTLQEMMLPVQEPKHVHHVYIQVAQAQPRLVRSRQTSAPACCSRSCRWWRCASHAGQQHGRAARPRPPSPVHHVSLFTLAGGVVDPDGF